MACVRHIFSLYLRSFACRISYRLLNRTSFAFVLFNWQKFQRPGRFQKNVPKALNRLPVGSLLILPNQARLWPCGRGDLSTPSFGSHLNPISTRGGRLCPPYTGVHTKFWKPQARLMCKNFSKAFSGLNRQ